MIVIAGFVLGAALGASLAKRRGGRGLDMLQYGAGFGICFAVVGLFLTVIIDRMV